MENVFISYVRENSSQVDQLASILKIYDIKVWLDKESIQPGSRWKESIKKAINEGLYFLPCFSTEYFNKSRSYMNEELILAIEELRVRPHEIAWFIPLKLNDCEIPDRPIGGGETLRSIQFVDLHNNWDLGIEKLLSVIQPISGVVHKFTVALESESAREKIKGADNLGKLGKIAKTAFNKLKELLNDKNETVVASAIEAIGNIGEIDKEAFYSIIAKTPDDGHHYYPRKHANQALIKLGNQVIPYLIDSLGSEYKEAAIETLGEIGPAAISELNKAIKVPHLRNGAISALDMIGRNHDSNSSEVSYQLLIQLVEEDFEKTISDFPERKEKEQANAINTLGAFKIKDAIPVLINKLQNPNLCLSACFALSDIKDPIALKPLVEVLFDQNISWVDRGAAAVAIGNFGELAYPVLPELEKALEIEVKVGDEKWDERSRDAVIDAINKIKDPNYLSILEGKGYKYEMWGIY
jgi:HEAT repeat protein